MYSWPRSMYLPEQMTSKYISRGFNQKRLKTTAFDLWFSYYTYVAPVVFFGEHAIFETSAFQKNG